ncbi:leucyl aminopeptidase [Tenacibaculum finnmarkense]|uniref:leucyl aminopeptidase family protein n=1 Tax=Tenacibaculum finnmarkense TaxID=2781243 RepID=UPI001EFC0451|nr:leucyl aminopeptidase [Tenacibaculum finnmarkense]MCG8882634.1 leucyl aminopeptidase [Tenacibaculum finnmarkense]
MNYKYQKTTINSFVNKVDIPKEISAILIINNKKECEDYHFSKSLKENILDAFLEKRNDVFIELTNQKNFILCISNNTKENLRKLGAILYQKIQQEKTKTVFIKDTTISEKSYFSILEGLLLSSYNFDKYKKEKKSIKTIVYVPKKQFAKEKVEELQILVEATSLTKTLVNEPLNYMDSLKFAEVASKMGQKYGFETKTLHKKEIEELKIGGLLAVNKGSKTPPTFNIFTYKPENPINKKPIVLVGKGVMFDTGGYSLKTGSYMSGMKSDMAGGASVLGAMTAIAGNKLKYHVIGLVPATDNKISSDALVVDDVITTMDNTTVEVLNTDAEGRLVLCDALTYAKRYKPELVIDIATLTGSAAAITGDFCIAMAGNTKSTMNELKKCGNKVHERLFELPFWDDYKELLTSDIADLKNIGGKIGGATTAGKFLEHFTDYPWIHLDIAGIAFIDKNKDYRQSGGTSAPVRLIYEFIKNKK